MIDLSVIIVSYNTREFLEKCLRSVDRDLKNSSLAAEVIVVDNDSKDGSIELLKQLKNHKSYFINHILFNRENLGFGRANNQGARAARGRYLLFLNPDTEVKSGALAEMVDFMDKNSEVGIASCKLLNSDGTIQPQGGNLPRLSTVAVWALFLDDLPGLREILPSYQMRSTRVSRRLSRWRKFARSPSPARPPAADSGWPQTAAVSLANLPTSAAISARNSWFIGWVGGTAMFVRREAWEELGGFDEKIFMYGEDVELCYRAYLRGWKVAVNPEAEIAHTGKASGGKWVTGEVEGLLYIFRKHKPGWEMPILRAILAAGMGLRWLIFGILAGNEILRRGYAEAFRVVRQ